MPDRPAYGWRWRSVTRPAALRRAGGQFSDDGRHYRGGARCARCGVPDGPVSMWQGSTLDVAHLAIPPGEPGHDDDENLAVLCRSCHRRHDYQQWATAFRAWLLRQAEERRARKDAERPLLVLMVEEEEANERESL